MVGVSVPSETLCIFLYNWQQQICTGITIVESYTVWSLGFTTVAIPIVHLPYGSSLYKTKATYGVFVYARVWAIYQKGLRGVYSPYVMWEGASHPPLTCSYHPLIRELSVSLGVLAPVCGGAITPPLTRSQFAPVFISAAGLANVLFGLRSPVNEWVYKY